MSGVIMQDKLSRALASCGRVASSKAGLPILTNVLIEEQGGSVVVASTDLELATSTTIKSQGLEAGRVAVPAKLISEVVSSLSKGKMEISFEKKGVRIGSGRATSLINGVDADEFPEIPSLKEDTAIHYKVAAEEFKNAMNQILPVVSRDQTRPVLTGILWHSLGNALYVVGSDGYRLAEKRLLMTDSSLSAIVPSRTLSEAVRLIDGGTDEITLLFDESQVKIRVGDTELTSRLINGKYPDYKKLIPGSTTVNAAVDTAEMSRTAKLAGLFAQDTGGSIAISADDKNNKLVIKTVASERGENESELEGKVEGEGVVTLNSRYLLEAVSLIDSKSTMIGFSGKLSPVVVRGDRDESYVHIVMPLSS